MYSQTASLNIPEDSSTRVFICPRLRLIDDLLCAAAAQHSSGNLVSTNFYWLSTQPDVFDWQANDYPTRSFHLCEPDGFTDSAPAQVAVTWTSEPAIPTGGAGHRAECVAQLAFFVHLTVLQANGARTSPSLLERQLLSVDAR